jgi:hypothetical protein
MEQLQIATCGSARREGGHCGFGQGANFSHLTEQLGNFDRLAPIENRRLDS